MAEKVSRDRGYRSDTIALSRDMGPLSPREHPESTPVSSSTFGSAFKSTSGDFPISALGTWGRTHMGLDGVNRIVTGFTFSVLSGYTLYP